MSLKAAQVILGNADFHLRWETGLAQQGLRGQGLGQAGSAGQVAAHDFYRPHHLIERSRGAGGSFSCQSPGSVRGQHAERSASYAYHEQDANQNAPLGRRELGKTLQSPHAACQSSAEFKSAKRAFRTTGRRARVRGYDTFFTGRTLTTRAAASNWRSRRAGATIL